jgi:F-type H+-transporting ATPase subunit b
MEHLLEDPKFWLSVSFVIFIILMAKPFRSMFIGGLDNKIEEIKKNINESLQSFTEAEKKVNEAQKQTADLDNKISQLLADAKNQAQSLSQSIIEKTQQSIASKEKNSLERIKQIEISAIQTIKSQASAELNKLIVSYLNNLPEGDKNKILDKSLSDLKVLN